MNPKIKAWLTDLNENYCQDMRLAKRFKLKTGEMATTKWKETTLSNWEEKYPRLTPNYRQILTNELVLESDFPTQAKNKIIADKILDILDNKNINYWSIFTGSKSYHIHLMMSVREIGDLNIPEIKKQTIKSILPEALYNKLDEANFFNIRLIQIEFARNPKTGNLPKIYRENINGKNIVAVTVNKKINRALIKADWKKDLAPINCPSLDYMLENYVKDDKQKTRHHCIAPSMAAYIRFKTNRYELAAKYYEAQQKPYGELESWDSERSYFGCTQVRKYMEANGLGNICAICLFKEVE